MCDPTYTVTFTTNAAAEAAYPYICMADGRLYTQGPDGTWSPADRLPPAEFIRPMVDGPLEPDESSVTKSLVARFPAAAEISTEEALKLLNIPTKKAEEFPEWAAVNKKIADAPKVDRDLKP